MIEDIQQDIVELLKDLYYNIDRDYADELSINYKSNIVKVEIIFISNQDVRCNIEYDRNEGEINIVNTCEHAGLQATKELSSPMSNEIHIWFDKVVECIKHKEEALERERAYNQKHYGRDWI